MEIVRQWLPNRPIFCAKEMPPLDWTIYFPKQWNIPSTHRCPRECMKNRSFSSRSALSLTTHTFQLHCKTPNWIPKKDGHSIWTGVQVYMNKERTSSSNFDRPLLLKSLFAIKSASISCRPFKCSHCFRSLTETQYESHSLDEMYIRGSTGLAPVK